MMPIARSPNLLFHIPNTIFSPLIALLQVLYSLQEHIFGLQTRLDSMRVHMITIGGHGFMIKVKFKVGKESGLM
jgi:hypothetical protein